MGPEFAFHRSRTMKLSLGVSVGFTHTKCSLAPKEILMLVVTGQSLLKTVYTPLLEIPNWIRNMVTTTVMKASLMLQYWHHCTPALIVVSVSGKTWLGILSLATTRIILSRVEMRVTSLRSIWLPCTTSLRWTHCVATLVFVGCRVPAIARADPNLVHRWLVQPAWQQWRS